MGEIRDLRLRCSSCGFAALVALLAGLAAGCHSNGTTVGVMVSPPAAVVALQGTTQFFATVTGATDTSVTWQVNGVTGGSATCGTIATNGLYTAPSAIPVTTTCAGTTTTATACTTTTNGMITTTSGCILITAVSNQTNAATHTAAVTLTSGVVITLAQVSALTVGTSETLQLQATVTGATNVTVNWLVNSVQGGDLSTTGSITSTTIGDGTLVNSAIYTAPVMVPSPQTVTIEAQSAADATQFKTVSLTVVMAADPTLSSIEPLNAPAGAYAQDFYLSGANFLSTTSVLFNGTSVGTLTGGSVTAVNPTLLRAHVPSVLLGTAGSTNTVVAQRENGDTTSSITISLVPVRPVLLAATPAALVQNSPTTTVELDGGYYTPSTLSEFNGHLAGTIQDSTFPRTLQAIVNSIDLTEPGLFSIAVRTPNATPPRSAVNLTIRPAADPMASNTIHGFSKPVGVALNDVTGIPVVLDQGTNSVKLLDAGFTTITGSVTVGTLPTSVAVDGQRNFALVTDNGSSDVAVVDLSAPALTGKISLAPTLAGSPVAVGVDEIHGRALVVGQTLAAAVVLDTSACPAGLPIVLGTVPVFTGTTPQVTVLPQLGWAFITPGGNGPLTVVDLVRLTVVFASTVNSTTRGVAVNSETKSLLLADPASPFGFIFSLLDQSVSSLSLSAGNVAAAINPLTNVGLLLNPTLHIAYVLDLSVPVGLSVVPLGSDPIALVIDPVSDKALVADDVDATVTVLDLGATRSRAGEPQILGLSRSVPVTIAASPAGAVQTGTTVTITTTAPHGLTTGDTVLIAGVGSGVGGYNGAFVATVTSSTQFTFTDLTAGLAASGGGSLVGPTTANVFASPTPVPLVVFGGGFTAASQVRLNETVIPTTFVNSRELTASIPPSFLTQPLRLVVDVQNSATVFSNVEEALVGLSVAVGVSPLGVGIDVDHDIGLAVNSTDGTVSVVNLSPGSPTFGAVTSLITVGNTPVAVGVVSRLGFAAVTNAGAATTSVVNLTTNPITVPSVASVGAGPTGVGASESLGTALVTNTASNSVSLLPLSNSAGTQASSAAVDQGPDAAAVAPDLNLAVVAHVTSNDIFIMDISGGSPEFQTRQGNIATPTGADYDPVNQVFLVDSSSSNTVIQIDPVTLIQSSIRVGVNPTSLAYDFQSGTLLTLNTASNTLSVVDLPNSQVRDILPLSGSVQYALALHPRLSLFVLSDSANNRILLLPMPR